MVVMFWLVELISSLVETLKTNSKTLYYILKGEFNVISCSPTKCSVFFCISHEKCPVFGYPIASSIAVPVGFYHERAMGSEQIIYINCRKRLSIVANLD